MAKEITGQQVFELLPRRKADSHKGSYGKVLCLCGSARFRGAAALAVEGALRVGAGLVTLAAVLVVWALVVPVLVLPCLTALAWSLVMEPVFRKYQPAAPPLPEDGGETDE